MQVVSIGEIKPNPSNPRLIKDDKFKKLVQSLKDFPEMANVRPIVVNQDMVILGGNMRFKAMKEAKWKQVPVQVVDWDEAKQREFIIKDNVGFGEWDWDDLANNWDAEELDKWGLDVPEFEAQQEEAVEDDYEMPDEIQTDIVLGDLFEIGEHRLLCGDSTDSDAVAKLIDGKEPYLMVTDPPYGIDYKPEWRSERMPQKNDSEHGRSIGKVLNDTNADWTLTWAISPSKVAYVYHAGLKSHIVGKSLIDCDYELKSMIIWVKSHFAIGRSHYHDKKEPCYYAVKKGSKGNWAGDRKQTTVWEIDKPQKNETGHSTQKPVECMARPIKNHDGDVYDPFLGSGTTMVAAHQLKRKCYGMELDPKYCQVIVDRMLKLDPTLTVKRNGQPYLPGGTNQGNNKDAKPSES